MVMKRDLHGDLTTVQRVYIIFYKGDERVKWIIFYIILRIYLLFRRNILAYI